MNSELSKCVRYSMEGLSPFITFLTHRSSSYSQLEKLLKKLRHFCLAQASRKTALSYCPAHCRNDGSLSSITIILPAKSNNLWSHEHIFEFAGIRDLDHDYRMTAPSTWLYWALRSSVFAAFTAILGKVGIQGLASDLATLIRTTIIIR